MATEDEGAASVEQTAEGGQLGRDGVDADDLGLKIDGGGVDAAVAVGGGSESRASLIGGKGRVLDEEKLSADLQDTVGSLAAVHPYGGAVWVHSREVARQLSVTEKPILSTTSQSLVSSAVLSTTL